MGKNEILYKLFKEVLKNTEMAQYFDDKYAFAYLEQEKDFKGGRFVTFRTGYNTDRVISFVQTDDGKISCKAGYRHNYGNYEVRMLDDGRIEETNNYGWGSIEKVYYDKNFKEINSTFEQHYGSCCD